jgi:hypothetical protein
VNADVVISGPGLDRGRKVRGLVLPVADGDDPRLVRLAIHLEDRAALGTLGERRRGTRVPVHERPRVELRLVDSEIPVTFAAQLEDLSQSGIALSFPQERDPAWSLGRRLSLRFQLQFQRRSEYFDLVATLRSRRPRGGRMVYGLEFDIDADPQYEHVQARLVTSLVLAATERPAA